jgi:hypothetical protein
MLDVHAIKAQDIKALSPAELAWISTHRYLDNAAR